MADKKEIINILDRPWSYDDIEYWTNPKDKCCNAVIEFNEKRSRLRAGILIVKDDEILLAEEAGQEGEFSLPGGGLEKDETPVDAAKREAEEEVFIEVKNARDTGYDYCETHTEVVKWVKDNVPEKKWWYNYYTCLIIAEYAGDYFGDVDKVDLDKTIKATSRWYKIKDVINKPTFKKQWKKALIDFGYYKEALTEGYYSNTPHRGATYITKTGRYIWAKGEDHPGLIDLLDLDMDEEEVIDEKGWIRCDSGLSYAGDAPASFIELPEKPITEAQYVALETWMETCCTGDVFQVSVTSGEFQDYDMDYRDPKYILNRVRYFYNQGELKEALTSNENKEDLLAKAKAIFGIAGKANAIGYLLPDGACLDFGDGHNMRGEDHRAICQAYDDELDTQTAYMLDFMVKTGAIRVLPELPGFNIINEPTQAQYEMIQQLCNYHYGTDGLVIEIDDNSGNELTSWEYDYEVSPRQVVLNIKNYYNKTILHEDTRTALINKSRNVGNYTGDTSRGKNRFERKRYSKVATVVKQYNQLDMNDFFKKDVLLVKVPVTGETNSYTVSIKMEGVCAEIARNIKSNNNKLEFRTIIQAITKIFNTNDIYVNCTCADYCLHPDTKIKLLNGETVTVEKLESIVKNATNPVYLYSVDNTGDFKPGKIKDVWVNGWVDHMLKITLDNGKEIITTDEHPYMLRNGQYKPANELQVGQSLMPLYFGKTANGYETVKANSIATTEFFSTYKQVANALLQDEIEEAKIRSGEDKIAIHHKDFNKNNNSPENLYPMGFNEHYKYHYDHVKDSPAFKAFKDASEEYRKLVLDHTTPEYQKQAQVMSQAISDYWQNLSDEQRQLDSKRKSDMFKQAWADGSYDTAARKAADERRRATLHTPEMEASAKAGTKQYWANLSPAEREEVIKQRTQNLAKGAGWNKGKHLSDEDKLHKSQAALNRTPEEKAEHNRKIRDTKMLKVFNKMLEDKVALTAENYEEYRWSYFKYAPPLEEYFSSIEDAITYFKLNHKIIKIERIDYDMLQPVYDIEVENYHNFYVDAGIVLHNCYRFAHWNIVNNVSTEDTAHDPGPGKNIRNPNDDKGRGCKHVLLVLNNTDWLMKVASVINNYIHYTEEHMQKPFLNIIFPKLYGIPANEMVTQNLIDTDEYLESSAGLIDAINEYGKNRGRYKAGSNKNPVTGTGGRTKKQDETEEDSK